MFPPPAVQPQPQSQPQHPLYKNYNVLVRHEFRNEDVEKLLEKKNTTINEFILTHGSTLYLNASGNVTQNEIHRRDLELLALEYEKKQELAIQKVSNDFMKDILRLQTRNKDLEERGKELAESEYIKILQCKEDVIRHLQEEIQQMRDNLVLVNNRLYDLRKEGNDQLMTEFREMKTTFHTFFKDNAKKGTFGEFKIEYYLSSHFPDCKLQNTSFQSASGDFYMEYRALKLLIESKNVQVLKKEEIDKFYRDLECQAGKGTINSALCISLHNTNLPNGYRNFCFEIRAGIPVIFISDIFHHEDSIRNAILTLSYLIQHNITNKIESDDVKIEQLVNGLQRSFDFMVKQKLILEKEKKSLESLLQMNYERKQQLYDVHELLDSILKKYPDIDLCSHPSSGGMKQDNRFELLTDLCVQHIQENPQFVVKLETVANVESVKQNQFSMSALKIFTIKKIKDRIEEKLAVIQKKMIA